ncbi:ABC transporter permease [Asanoa ishikariensis]|uniref:Cellobiose ABC transporter membrane protein n=1 Tax=Asanoa ishikariensis TaxID=137265 RepID=A0A1H3S5G9_9ACTN|nr:sugar ABC transporter permease [Asanoa ishikariensis]GIF66500.1 ABC transporter permease [Asanoa ishikariensis]SDZ32825.1 cellobiose ABC transporter membrane protein [Asanoa ishikariensis]
MTQLATEERAGPRRGLLHRLDVKGSPYLYIAPFFILFLGFGVFPLIFTAWVSLHEWSLLSEEHTWIGFGNYTKLFDDPAFWNALWNTVSIWVISTVPQLVLALVLAHILNQRLRGQTFWRMSALIPNITSVAAVAIIFSQLFGRDYGLFNWVLGLFGIDKIDWTANTWSSHVAVSTMIIWRWTGYNALIYLAAMQAVPKELYDSASLDGASSFQQLRKITVPAIRPTIIFTVIISTIGGMQVLAEPLLFGGNGLTGGSDRQFQTLALYLYEVAFGRFDFGYASASSWVMFLIIVIVAAINFGIISRLRRS